MVNFHPASVPTWLTFSRTGTDPESHERPLILIFFITGNPGLINYYHDFLRHLQVILSEGPLGKKAHFVVCGRSLKGFEKDGKNGPDVVLSLEDQIEAVKEDLLKRLDTPAMEHRRVRTILMGHSVGAYILLEVLQRLQGKLQDLHTVVGGICLFPTVVDIAKSDSGKVATPLLSLPYAPSILSSLARALSFLLPLGILTCLIEHLLRFPHIPALTTATFLKSPLGVHQALHMARDEMRSITTDSWGDEIWGSASANKKAGQGRIRLFFLFGAKDHWVANVTRETLIRSRGRKIRAVSEEWKPTMEVDETEGWPHGFCIRHSIPVAERVRGYVGEIIEERLADETEIES